VLKKNVKGTFSSTWKTESTTPGSRTTKGFNRVTKSGDAIFSRILILMLLKGYELLKK